MRQYHLFVALMLMLMLTGCAGDDGSSKPDDLIPADRMANILTEIHMAESQVGRYALSSSDSTKLMFDRLYNRILKKFEVDTSSYRLSYIYYSSHPDKLEAIYKEVTGTLGKIANPSSTSATTGSALSGSATSVLATTNLGAAMKVMSRSATSGSSASATSSTRAFLRRRK
ncbi:MAG: DUF4296 domain-containing protein [Rudanella sp.]|nr:DUF4296 domain-containing protein [Rudanella sp.]